jgi:hypothetical protein
MSAFSRVDYADPVNDFGDFGRCERAGDRLLGEQEAARSGNSE